MCGCIGAQAGGEKVPVTRGCNDGCGLRIAENEEDTGAGSLSSIYLCCVLFCFAVLMRVCFYGTAGYWQLQFIVIFFFFFFLLLREEKEETNGDVPCIFCLPFVRQVSSLYSLPMNHVPFSART